MSIILDSTYRVLVQGITGREGGFHTTQMADFGTTIVGGVTPGKGGEWVHGVPVFDSVAYAVEATEANASVIFVPPEQAADAMFEAIDAGIKLIVCISEGIPVHDAMRVHAYLQSHDTRLIGPNCPGIVVPEVANLGIIPGFVTSVGHVGVVSRSGTLTYEVTQALTLAGIGQSTIIGIGGDQIIGTSMIEVLDLFENDPDTSQIVLLGEIGGYAELQAADYIKNQMTKPVSAFISGHSAPYNHRMGHAGAIITDERETAAFKVKALEQAGVRIAETPEDVPARLSGY